MSTAPYAARAAELLPYSLGHVATVTALPLSGEPFTLDMSGASLEVTMDENWSPHIQVTMTGPVPEAVAQLDALDGRSGTRLRVDAGYIYPDLGEDVHLLADVGLRRRQVLRPSSNMTVLGVSDEIRAQDRRSSGTLTPGFTTFAQLVSWCAGQAMFPEVPVIVNRVSDASGSAAVAGLEISAGSDLWGPLADVANRAGIWVHCDTSRRWIIRARASGKEDPAWRLAVGEAGTVLDSDSSLDREDWANSVLLEYSFVNDAGNPVTVIGRANIVSGPLRPSVVGFRTHHEKREFRVTQAQANEAAASVLRNFSTRGRSLTLTALAAYWLRPGMPVDVQLRTGPAEKHIIKSVTFKPLAGLMTIQTREPHNDEIGTGD